MILTRILLILVMIVFSAFFSGSEIAYSTASRLQLRNAAEKGRLADRRALEIFEDYDRTLITILIGNNLVNIASSSLATVIAVSLMGDNGAWIATFVMTLVILTFGEIIPKIVAAEVSEDFARVAALPLHVLCILTKPLVVLVEKLFSGVDRKLDETLPDTPAVTEDDIESVIDTVEDEGVMDEDRCDLLQSAMDFDDVLAYEVITPRVDMVAIDIDDPLEEIRRIVLSSPYTRIPVYRDTVDNIIGILHLNPLLLRATDTEEKPIESIEDFMMPVTFVHKTMPLPDVLKTMKKRRCHMVVVTDEYGGTMGILTMEDVLEQLVGDIWDESDEIEPEFVEVAEHEYDVDGDMRTEDLLSELDLDDRDFDDDNATVGGWAIEMLGGYPKEGDSFTYRNLTITVTRMMNIRVMRLHVHEDPMEGEE